MSIVRTSPPFNPERGAILLISLLMLIVMTVLAVASFDESHTVQRITKNMINFTRADSSNDAGQIAAAAWLNSLTQRPDTCTASPCGANLVWKRAEPGSPAPPLAETMDDAWWSVNGRNINGTIYGVLNQPLYVISEVGCDNAAAVRYYRIVSKSVGSTNPPKQFSVRTVKSTLPPPMDVMFDLSRRESGKLEAYGGSAFQNTFNPAFSGEITGVWAGTGCDGSSPTATLVISAFGRPTLTYNVTFQRKKACSYYNYGPRENMSYAALPQPYPVLQTDRVTIQIKNFSSTIDYFHPPGSDFSKPTAIRMTVEGIPDMCQ